MKKILSILTVLFLVFLAGCSSSKEGTKTFVSEQNGVKMKLTYYYSGDKVTKQTANNTMEYSKMGVTKEQLQELVEPISKQYQGIKGLTQSIDFQDDKAVETLTIDYTQADLKDLKGISGVEMGSNDANSISLKMSEEALLKEGFTEKK